MSALPDTPPDAWTLDDVAAARAAGARVLLMVRHAERPKLDNDDPSFGMTVPLTPAGHAMAREYGRLLKRFATGRIQFYASPLRRTRETAADIAAGMGLENLEIPTDDALGNSSPYFADQYAVYTFFREGGFFEKVFAYIATERQVGFRPLHEATRMLEDWLLAHFTGDLGIFTTHDLYLAAYLAAWGAVPVFSCANWPRFLDAAALVLAPDGTRHHALVRAGLTDGICGV